MNNQLVKHSGLVVMTQRQSVARAPEVVPYVIDNLAIDTFELN
jgi:hypothetical protein